MHSFLKKPDTSVNNDVALGDVGIIGISGRMGQRIVHLLQQEKSCTWIGGYDSVKPEKGLAVNNVKMVFEQASIIMDFSHASLFPEILQAALNNPRPMIIGTSGIPESLIASLKDLALKVPILIAPNTSLGAVIQRWIARKITQFLPSSYDIDIIENHHRYKKDYPSGTALALGKTIVDAKKELGINLEIGETSSPRIKNRIEMHALRCGNVSGMHEILWTSPEDRLVLGHTVFSPDVFAHGAINLLKWVSQRSTPECYQPGLYTVEDVLGLKEL